MQKKLTKRRKNANPTIRRKVKHNPKRSQTNKRFTQFIHPDKLERNPTFTHTSHTGDSNGINAQQNNSNKNPRPTQQNVQIAFQRKATSEYRKQDSNFITLYPSLNLEQIRNNANTITRNSPTQPNAVINKKISKTNFIKILLLNVPVIDVIDY
ncbi:Hypothetical_protein [Hexamita inflata]|uniref:Hypothetical_protein n=1 Tax=Hexamita inflata TaxID=28002 RepID=A0AA86V155_9EUKA|nr:Hypothetical protein HINF_LOCUS64154 [Hexamita inflata]